MFPGWIKTPLPRNFYFDLKVTSWLFLFKQICITFDILILAVMQNISYNCKAGTVMLNLKLRIRTQKVLTVIIEFQDDVSDELALFSMLYSVNFQFDIVQPFMKDNQHSTHS